MQDKQVTSGQRAAGRGQGAQSRHAGRFLQPPAYSLQPNRRSAFTLTELLIVIAIIAVLAGLIAAAAVNAIGAANRGRITLEIKNISGAVEDFKTKFGSYPPNGMSDAPSTTPGSAAMLARADFVRMFKSAFPRHNEPNEVIEALAGYVPSSPNFMVSPGLMLDKGMRGEEALYFWLGGFSDDEQYPLSGVGGPSFVTNSGGVEIMEERKRRYEFDLAKLGPKDDNGAFAGRFVTYKDPRDPSIIRRINFWQYAPSKSEKPLVYFDVSRYKPGKGNGKYDVWSSDPAVSYDYVYAIKQLRQGAPGVAGTMDNVVFVDQGKFQVLHPGLDDAWGADFQQMGSWSVTDPDDLVLYPAGPFLGEIGDTLTSFTDGELAEEAEE